MDANETKASIDKALSDYKGARAKLNTMIDKLKGPLAHKLRGDVDSVDEIIKGYNFDQDGSTNTSY